MEGLYCMAFTDYVNPFAGTGGIPWASGMTFPGAAMPFGMVRPGPDTCFPLGIEAPKVGTCGYWYGKTHIAGFSHTHISGAGIPEGGLFRVTPFGSRPLRFSHRQETASPGYYAVRLPGCLAELTAAQRVGVHRYTFDNAKDARLFINAGSFLGKGHAEKAQIQAMDAHIIEGEVRAHNGFAARYGGLKAYFYAECDAGFQAENCGGAGLLLRFCGMVITLRLGLSYISREEARNNLRAECAGANCAASCFDVMRAEARLAWEERLSAIKISASAEIKRIFYTALYHCMLHPTNMTEASGNYLGFHGSVGTAENFTYRSDLSLWDTFRTAHPLYCLIAPDIQRDSALSLLRMAEATGAFPRWPGGGGEGGSMFGNPAHMVMAESYLKGFLTREEAEAALRFIKQAAREDGYARLGYVSSNTRGSVSRTLEYAWADAAAALLARALGHEEDAARFFGLSQSFRRLWDPRVNYFRARGASGAWQKFCPRLNSYFEGGLARRFSPGFIEGSARQYRWHAVQDPQGLIALLGGKEAFVKELEQFMRDASRRRAAMHPGSGYWLGNEHNLHAAYLFNDAGRPDLTQKWVRWTLAQRFADGPGGLDGNDDLGALSAWYVFSALGFYPAAGTDRYWLGAPLVDEAALRLGENKTLHIIARSQNAENIYVKQITRGGEACTGTALRHGDIKDGGTLEFVMTSKGAIACGF